MGDDGEPAFDLIDPSGFGRRVVDMVVRSSGKPSLNLGVFAVRVIVAHKFPIRRLGSVASGMSKEIKKILLEMAATCVDRARFLQRHPAS